MPDDGGRRSASGGPGEDGVALVEKAADLLVGLDPGRRDAGVPEHMKHETPIAGVRIVVVRERLALVGQVVELAVLDRLADLPVDQGLPRRADLQPARGVAAADGGLVVWRIGHARIVASRAIFDQRRSTSSTSMSDGIPSRAASTGCAEVSMRARRAADGIVARSAARRRKSARTASSTSIAGSNVK